MAEVLNLSKERFQSCAGTMLAVCNGEILDTVKAAVSELTETGDSNAYIDRLEECKKKYGEAYNELMESTDIVLADLQSLTNVAEFIEKDDIGDIEKKETLMDEKPIENPLEIG